MQVTKNRCGFDFLTILIFSTTICALSASCITERKAPRSEALMSSDQGESADYDLDRGRADSARDSQLDRALIDQPDTELDVELDIGLDVEIDSRPNIELDIGPSSPIMRGAQWFWRQGLIGVRYQAQSHEAPITLLQVRLIDVTGSVVRELNSDLRTHEISSMNEGVISGALRAQTELEQPAELWVRAIDDIGGESEWKIAGRAEVELLSPGAPCIISSPFEQCSDGTSCAFSLDQSEVNALCTHFTPPRELNGAAHFNAERRSIGLSLSGVIEPPHRLDQAVFSVYSAQGETIVQEITERFLDWQSLQDERGHFSLTLSFPWLNHLEVDRPAPAPSVIVLTLYNELGQASAPLSLIVEPPLPGRLGDECDDLGGLSECEEGLSCNGRCIDLNDLPLDCDPSLEIVTLEGISGSYQGDTQGAARMSRRWCDVVSETDHYRFTAPQSGYYFFRALTEGSELGISSRSYCAYPTYEPRCSRLRCNGDTGTVALLEAGETTYLMVGAIFNQPGGPYTLRYDLDNDENWIDFCY